MVIELDGSIHENVEVKLNDEVRQKLIEEDGMIVIRFKNEEVLKNITHVRETILQKCNELA